MQSLDDIKASDLQRVGVSKVYAHQLLAGGKSPSLALALKLESELGIPPRAWPLPKRERPIGRPSAANDDTRSSEAA